MGFWPIVRTVVKKSDIILFILDVRMPELSRNRALEMMISLNNKMLINVFNKIDLVSDTYLRDIMAKYKGAFFVSGTQNMGISRLRTELFIIAKQHKINDPIIGVVGYPNVGKSAIINALAHRARAKVSGHAGTTRGIQWIKAGGLFIMDSPGVIPFEDGSVKLGILGSKDPDKIGNIEGIAIKIADMFLGYNKKIFEDLYNVNLPNDNILEELARKKGFLLKGGIPDERRAALQIIKDWQNGKLRL